MFNAIYTALWLAITGLAIFELLTKKRDPPSSTLAWLFFVILVPFAGPLIFYLFGPQRLERDATQRRIKLQQGLAGNRPKYLDLPTDSPFHSVNDLSVLKLAGQISDFSATSGNDVWLLPDPETALAEMRAAIENAKEFIHLEYYIFGSDEVTEQLFDSLIAATKRKVEVRILYDALGSLFLKKIQFHRLIAEGIQITGFIPLSSILQRINLHFRNHRKLLIIDGKVAFTGGTNIGKEYLGRTKEYQWRDYTVLVRGSVCNQLQEVFAKDWLFSAREDLSDSKYYPDLPATLGTAIVQVLESGPDTPFQTLHQAIFLALTLAKKEILLTTPYFVPDSTMLTALSVAALRGVKVNLLLPAKTDAPLVRHAARSFYDQLLQTGVKIFEYQPRILHAKLIVIDNVWTILGSANMDIRSFRLNFELNLLTYDIELATQASESFRSDLEVSKEIIEAEFNQRSTGQKMLENACRLLSPIL